MTLYDSVQLRLQEKIACVWEGRFLSSKEIEAETVVLYRVHDFFCEVYYEKKENSVVRVRPFRANEMLQDFFSYQYN